MKNSTIFLTLLVGTLLFMIGCSSSMHMTQPLDVRKFKIEASKEEGDQLRVVLGVKDLMDCFQKSTEAMCFLQQRNENAGVTWV